MKEASADRDPIGGSSSRTALRFGYAAVIALLVFSTFQAYRIERFVSDQRIDLYRQYVKQDEAISQIRKTIWLAGNYVRDFFLSSDANRTTLLKSQIADLETQSRKAVNALEKTTPEAGAARTLDAELKDYWNKLKPVPESMAAVPAAPAIRFIQQEIVPRRNALYDQFQRITEAGQTELQKNDLAFAEKRQDAVRRLLFMLGLCVALGIAVAWISLRYAGRLERQTAAQYEEVARAKREIEQLPARLLEAEEDSRRRLSRELHDEIGQNLAVLEIELTRAHALTDDSQTALRERLLRARELAEKTVQTVRNISLLLRPALLDDLGLTPALQWLLEDFEKRSGVTCEFSEEGIDDFLPDSVKTCVYRVTQEALHNCEKHSGASQARVMACQINGEIQVEIEDNGRGLELDPNGMPGHNGGLGLLGMRERAARVGGALTLESALGRGTRVSLRIPLSDLAGPARKVSTGEESGVSA